MNYPPVRFRDWSEAIRQTASIMRDIIDGRSNAIGNVTLTENVTTTQVDDVRVSVDSVISLMPETSNAAAEAYYVATVANGSFTITHANNSQTDRTYRYAIQG